MKGIIIFTLILLAGCTSVTSLEQLEAEALTTGDWSAVEKRERVIARRNSHTGIHCPSGTIAYCESIGTKKDCSCVESNRIRAFLGISR